MQRLGLFTQSTENFWHLGPLRSHLLSFRYHTAKFWLAGTRSAEPVLRSVFQAS